MTAFVSTCYANTVGQVTWSGLQSVDQESFKSFLAGPVAGRLSDEDGRRELEVHLRGLASTGFANDNLNAILQAGETETHAWAVGEAIAEAHLTVAHNVLWPWNMERDKRNPRASLQGADLIGFQDENDKTHLVLGEVKTSSDAKTPPGVMNGRGGMIHQIDNLANDLSIICTILKWLHPRCKGTEFEARFNSSITAYLESGNKAVRLFGVLIRDTSPTDQDLSARGTTLSGIIEAPTVCGLMSLYLPCPIADLPAHIAGEVK